jgi:hypothetical protein
VEPALAHCGSWDIPMRLTAATTAAIVAASSSAAAVVAVAPMAGDDVWPAAPQPTPWYSYPLPPHFPNDAGAFGSALAASRPRLWVLASEGESLGDVRVRLNTTLLRSPKLAAMAADMRRSAWQLTWCHRHAAAANCSNLLPALHSTKGVNQGAQTQDRIGALAWVAVLDPDAEFSAELPRAAYVARAFADLAAACSVSLDASHSLRIREIMPHCRIFAMDTRVCSLLLAVR